MKKEKNISRTRDLRIFREDWKRSHIYNTIFEMIIVQKLTCNVVSNATFIFVEHFISFFTTAEMYWVIVKRRDID